MKATAKRRNGMPVFSRSPGVLAGLDETVPEPSATGEAEPVESIEVNHALTIEAADTVIQEIFAVGLALASCAEMVGGPAAVRLAAAVGDLDAIVARLRKEALGQLSPRVDADADLITGHVAATGPDGIVEHLAALARHLSDLAGTADADGSAMIQLLDARQSLYRAAINLTAAPILDAASGLTAPGVPAVCFQGPVGRHPLKP